MFYRVFHHKQDGYNRWVDGDKEEREALDRVNQFYGRNSVWHTAREWWLDFAGDYLAKLWGPFF
jgi:hypothetical protein